MDCNKIKNKYIKLCFHNDQFKEINIYKCVYLIKLYDICISLKDNKATLNNNIQCEDSHRSKYV